MPDQTTAWRKSTRCGANGTCVEAARAVRAVLVRDAADPDGPRIALTPGQWTSLLTAIKESR